MVLLALRGLGKHYGAVRALHGVDLDVAAGEVLLTGVDGGQEVFARIRDPRSLMTATVAIPFEVMGEQAVEAIDGILQGTDPGEFTRGPFLYMDAVLVDSSNVPAEGEWPW